MINIYIRKAFQLKNDFINKCHFFSPFEAFLFTTARYIKIGNKKKHEAIIKKLMPDFLIIMNKYIGSGKIIYENLISQDSPIWILWLQGESQMPDIVKRCIKSVIDNAGTHKVHILDKKNIHDYINLPKIVLDKYSRGTITPTHFSDIIRMALLAKYGGYWIDATIFMTGTLVNYRLPFYSIRKHKDNGFPDCKDWSTYFIACGKNNTYIKIISEYYIWYWSNHDYIVDYFLLDYSIAMLFRNLPKFHEEIVRIPFDNENVHEMQKNLNSMYSDKLWNRLINTKYNKLSYKIILKSGNTIGQRVLGTL